jgi:hypothetical protein
VNAAAIRGCRICGLAHPVPVLDLGAQTLTGVFPRTRQAMERGPVEVVLCRGCGLVQLRHTHDSAEMYGPNYGYRSGLNASMVRHLAGKVANLLRLRPLRPGEAVIDIGSNDGTLLGFYPWDTERIGFDPTGEKFRHFYPEGVRLIPRCFPSPEITAMRAVIITSIAMFYDLPDPRAFVMAVADTLAPDGIWHFEQSYLPAMLRTGSYDTIVAEHLEYYSLGVVWRLLESCGLRVLDVQVNSVNGGSFAVTAAHAEAGFRENSAVIGWLLGEEERMGLRGLEPYREFARRVESHRASLRSLLRTLRENGKTVLGCGASTKGNCLLQYCGFTERDITAIGDVNPEKHGCFTPGTLIPIIPEEEARAMQPDYMLVPVWHFREGIIAREAEFLARGGRLIFPFPYVEIVG